MIPVSVDIPTLEYKIQNCTEVAAICTDITGVAPAVSLMTFYTAEETHEVAVCTSPHVDKALTEAINDARCTMIVSDTQKTLGLPKSVPLSSYFTPENEAKSAVVAHESALLRAAGYKIAQSFYFAIPVPPMPDQAQGIFFLFARNEEEAAKIKAKLLLLMEKLATL